MTTVEPTDNNPRRRVWLRSLGVIGILFGLMTLREGGAVMFIVGAARMAAGNYVPFVLWFNFLAGFVYVAAGLGLWFQRAWAARLALGIALATMLVFGALSVYVAAGGAYETRTVVAMTFRSTVWFVLGVIAWRLLRSDRRVTVTCESEP